MVFVLGVPSSSGAQSRVISSIPKDVVDFDVDVLPVGRNALLLLGGKVQDQSSKKGDAGGFPEEKIVIPTGITPETLHKFTFYDILGLAGDIGGAADIEAIRKAYHKAVLIYHPDKAQFKTPDGKEDRTVFLKIQDAFNVLCNEDKRRAYDSQLPFDESIPSEEKAIKAQTKGPQKFFKLFAPVFQRNARFAVQKPVPDVGDMDTPIADVYKFYEYWVKFDSWRDFTGVGAEHNPETATSREEKRWMQKENEKLAKKLKKKEMERLIALVTLAEKYDPRMIADKEQRKATKEAEKAAKENAAKQKEEEEAAAKAWAEAQEAEEREKQAANKMDKEKLKKAQSKGRNILRKLLRFSADLGHGKGEYRVISMADVELICAQCNLDELNEMNDAMGGEAASKDVNLVQAAGFDVVVNKVQQVKERENQQKEDEMIEKEAKKRAEADAKTKAEEDKKKKGSKAAATQQAAPTEKEWTRDELSMLAKSVARYPPGTPNRWQTITNFMNVQLKPATSYGQDELLKAAYMLAHNPKKI